MSELEVLMGQDIEYVRVPLNLWSLDRAIGFQNETGMLLPGIFEIYGDEHSGKSTLSVYMAGRVEQEGEIRVADLESGWQDGPHIRNNLGKAGFTGRIKTIDHVLEKRGGKKVVRPHRLILQEGVDELLNDTSVFIVDSIGMYASQAEIEDEIGAANWGKRGRDMAQFSRRALNNLRFISVDNPRKAVLLVNHKHDAMGHLGHTTPGGVTKNFAASTRLWMYRKDSKFDHGAFQAEIRVKKLRVGGVDSDKRGIVFIIPGIGVSPEMTAVLDCVRLGLAERGATIKLDVVDKRTGEVNKKSMGRINELVEKVINGDLGVFEPFFEALQRQTETMEHNFTKEKEHVEEPD